VAFKDFRAKEGFVFNETIQPNAEAKRRTNALNVALVAFRKSLVESGYPSFITEMRLPINEFGSLTQTDISVWFSDSKARRVRRVKADILDSFSHA
jgi:hypothetical protein